MKTKNMVVNHPVYEVVKGGIIKRPDVGEGRCIPALVVSAENDTDLLELIKIHTDIPPGDVELQWSTKRTLFSLKSVYLILEFKKPMEINFMIKFDLIKHSMSIDGIIQSRAFYLAVGEHSDSIYDKMTDSIFVEVPNLDFDKAWDEILKNILKKKLKKDGVLKKDIQNSIKEKIRSMREIWNLRS